MTREARIASPFVECQSPPTPQPMVGNLLDDDDTMRADDSLDSFEGRGASPQGSTENLTDHRVGLQSGLAEVGPARDGPKSLPVPSIKSSAAIRLRFSNRFSYLASHG
jgi:hypothetical protein